MSDKPKIMPPRLPGQMPKPAIKSTTITNKKNTGSFEQTPMANISKSRTDNVIINKEKERLQSPVLVLSFKQKKIIISIVAIVLSLALITGLIFLVLPKPTVPADVFINFSVDNTYIEFQEQVADGQTQKVMPGDSFNASFSVRSTDEIGSTDEVYVRVKLYCIMEENYYSDIFTYDVSGNSLWNVGADGFIYLNETLKANTKVHICSKIILKKETDNKFQGKAIQVYFYGECLQAGELSNKAIAEYWPTAPYQWIKNFGEGINGGQ